MESHHITIHSGNLWSQLGTFTEMESLEKRLMKAIEVI